MPAPDAEVPLLFSIQDETLSAFSDVNMAAAAAANKTVNTTDPNFAVRAVARGRPCAAPTLLCCSRQDCPCAGSRQPHLGPLAWATGLHPRGNGLGNGVQRAPERPAEKRSMSGRREGPARGRPGAGRTAAVRRARGMRQGPWNRGGCLW
jgi:hypothetical protein